jgi:hypothetical protein
MQKRNNIEMENKIAVDINGLQGMLSIGRNTAADIGEKAGAVIRIGRRKLYNVRKVEEYINKLTEV